MEKKKYVLPNGKEIYLAQIKKLGELKSVASGNLSRVGYWYFSIYFKDRTAYDVEVNYSYTDWIISKRKLQKIKDDILKALK